MDHREMDRDLSFEIITRILRERILLSLVGLVSRTDVRSLADDAERGMKGGPISGRYLNPTATEFARP